MCPECGQNLREVLEERREGLKKTYHHAREGRCCKCRSTLSIENYNGSGFRVTATPAPENQKLGTLGCGLPFFASAGGAPKYAM